MKQTIIVILMVLSAALSFAGDNMLTVLPELTKSDSDIIIAQDSVDGPETVWVDCLAWATTQYKGMNVRSLYNVDNVRKALELSVKYLVPVNESVTYAVIDSRSEADKLRALADELEQKVKDIEYIKSVLEALNN